MLHRALGGVVAGLDVPSLEQGVGTAPVTHDELSVGQTLEDILKIQTVKTLDFISSVDL